jgi:beta-phosphoglucomutase-like phosphatase (HAD superfamily)
MAMMHQGRSVTESEVRVPGLPETVRACLFDLDGVLTDTASVHRKAWTNMFDAFLRERADAAGDQFVPFDPGADYLKYVDGKRRQDGVRGFLASRGVDLPEGDPDDDPAAETVNGLGNRKNELFQRTLGGDGVDVFEGSRRYLEAVSAAGGCRRSFPPRCVSAGIALGVT